MFGLDFSDWRFWAIVVGVIVLLYVARPYAHKFLQSIFVGGAQVLNKLGMWFAGIGERGYQRYCETVSAHLAEEYENKIRNHQLRITRTVERHDKDIIEVVDKLEASGQEIDGSVEALREINLPKTTLDTIKQALAAENEGRGSKVSKAVNEVKKSVSTEVQRVRPELTKIRSNLKPIQQSVTDLRQTSHKFGTLADRVNKDMATFDEVVNSDNRMAVAQKQSIIIPWLLALLVMLIALSGVFLNFFLIARPMAEIVGDGMQVAGVSLPTIAAFVVILLEAVTGIVLMEAAGLTSLTGMAHTSGRTRSILFWSALGVLALFSAFEVFLALNREAIIAAQECVDATAVGLNCEEGTSGMSMSLMAQIILATVIPWLLAVAMVPLETVVRNLIFIIRIALHQIMMLASYLCRTLAAMLKAFGVFLLRLYDLVIFLPLAIERMVRSVASPRGAST